jgi:hypothetical protein
LVSSVHGYVPDQEVWLYLRKPSSLAVATDNTSPSTLS